ncbi:MAG: ATP synthase F1 subunit epsilon [Fibrobacterota bacterium]
MFDVEIYSPEKRIFKGQSRHLVALGTEGSFGILTGHAPFMTTLMPGPLRLDLTDTEQVIFDLSGGFIEVDNNRVIVLADSASEHAVKK